MRRVLELDALRGITALVIILAHLGLMVESPWVLTSVDLFFVLSGYFITNNILRDAASPRFLPRFFARRSLRIWPAYYVALVACLVLSRVVKWDQPPDAWPFYVTFTQEVHRYIGVPQPPFSLMFRHTWTLAIEEQYYLAWPVLGWWWLRRGGGRGLGWLIPAFVAVPVVTRMAGLPPFLLLTRCDGLALGGLLAVVLRDRERVERNLAGFRRMFAAVGLIALVLPLDGASLADQVNNRPLAGPGAATAASLFLLRAGLAYFGLAGLVLCSAGHRFTGLLRWRPLCYVGQVSYGLYLYHPLVFATLPPLYKRFFVRKLGLVNSHLLMDLAMIAVCFALAELSRRFVEGPFLKLKERVRGGRQAVPMPHVAVEVSAENRAPFESGRAAGHSE